MWLALSSLILVPLAGATRPRYGGTLTVELSSAWTSIESSDTIAPLIAETLVRLNDKGEIEPLLATAWQRDPDRKRRHPLPQDSSGGFGKRRVE